MIRLYGMVLALLLPALIGCSGEPMQFATKKISVPRPETKHVKGPLPRSILFVQVAERGQTIKERSNTSFYV
jgi:hypothetical protein